MNFLLSFFKDVFGYISIYMVVILLFVFYYFTIPEYWFLCSILTIITFGGVKVFLSVCKSKSK